MEEGGVECQAGEWWVRGRGSGVGEVRGTRPGSQVRETGDPTSDLFLRRRGRDLLEGTCSGPMESGVSI